MRKRFWDRVADEQFKRLSKDEQDSFADLRDLVNSRDKLRDWPLQD